MSDAGVVDSVLRRFQPRFRAVESTERSVAKVSAPDRVRKPPDIFIFTFIIRMLKLSASLYTLMQVFSVTVFEKASIESVILQTADSSEFRIENNQLNLFSY
jgi:hypothetical protein